MAAHSGAGGVGLGHVGIAIAGKAVATCFLAGICTAILAPGLPPSVLRWAGLLAGLLLWLASPHWRWLGALLAGMAWAWLHAGWGLDRQLPLALEGREVSVVGVVSSLPQHEIRRTRFQLRVDGDAAQSAGLQGRTVQVSWYDDFGATEPGPRIHVRAGERWRLNLRLRAPRGLINPGGFDAERHALAQGIVASAIVRQALAPQRLSAPAGLGAWREQMAARIRAQVPTGSSRYVQALALGDTRGLGEADWQVLRATGLTHLIAISGFHVGMVALCAAWMVAGVWRLLPWCGRYCPRPQAVAIGALIGATVYAAVAGFGLPTVRTVLMVAVVVLARLGRRPVDVAASLALAALAVLCLAPLSVLTAGFWLSFAGVAWLLWCLPERGHWLGSFLSAQRVATLGLLPLTVLLFGQASAIGPVANLLAIPWWSLVVVPLALLGTALEGLSNGAGGLAWRASAWCFDLSWPLFQALGSGRYALWWLPEPAWFALPLALFAAIWMLLPAGMPGKYLAVLLWLPLCLPWRNRPSDGAFELITLDVGQGLAVLVRTGQHSLLFDAGPAVADGFDAGERVVVPALRALGMQRLDTLVVSHGDHDHAGGVAAVQAVVPAHSLWAPPGLALQSEAGPICGAGQAWQWDGVRFEFLHPTSGFPYLGNESSCVLRVQGRYGTALLTGDIGEVIEQRLLKQVPAKLRADVVLVAHHGSGGSSSPAFVAATGARLALISNGHGNRFGHPRPDVVRRWQRNGAEVLATADSGALQVWLGEGGLQVRERRIWRSRLWDAAERARAAAILSDIKNAATAPEG